MNLFPRGIYFKCGKAVGSFPSIVDYDSQKTIDLPSDHYDFLGPIDVLGKTKEEIEKEVKIFLLKKAIEMDLFPRLVYFKDGKAIGVSPSAAEFEADSKAVIDLPSKHYDFLGPIKVIGKTKEEIEKEVKDLLVEEALKVV